MKISVLVLKPDNVVDVYIFLNGSLESLSSTNLVELNNQKIVEEISSSKRVYVLLDDQEFYYQNILQLPLLKGGELKKSISYELISYFEEKARFSFDTIGLKEDESGVSSLVQVVGIKESSFQKMVDSFRSFSDLIELVLPYPIAYTNFDPSQGVLIVETYEDKTKLILTHSGNVYLYRILPIGSSKTSKDEYLDRLMGEIERSTYYVKQNFDRSFEIRKLFYFVEDKSFQDVFDSFRLFKEPINLENYRGGLVAPYLLLDVDPKKIPLNILPPIVTYREISPYIFLFLLFAFIIQTALFGFSAYRLKRYSTQLRTAIENTRWKLQSELEYVKKNKMWLLTSGITNYQYAPDEFLKILSMSLLRGIRVSYLKTMRSPKGLEFTLEVEFENVPNFKREDLVREFVAKLKATGNIETVNYGVYKKGNELSYNIYGFMKEGK
ncbi:MAG: hypothetical protein ABIL77_02560 [candidate division WOR-3 bacterium]